MLVPTTGVHADKQKRLQYMLSVMLQRKTYSYLRTKPWHRRRSRVSVFSITRKLKKESTYPLDHYTRHFQWDKYFSISYIKMSQATNDGYECHFAVVSSLPYCIWIIRNTINTQYYNLASPSFTYIPTLIQTKDGLTASASGISSYTHQAYALPARKALDQIIPRSIT